MCFYAFYVYTQRKYISSCQNKELDEMVQHSMFVDILYMGIAHVICIVLHVVQKLVFRGKWHYLNSMLTIATILINMAGILFI